MYWNQHTRKISCYLIFTIYCKKPRCPKALGFFLPFSQQNGESINTKNTVALTPNRNALVDLQWLSSKQETFEIDAHSVLNKRRRKINNQHW